jgi:hypothetical protein
LFFATHEVALRGHCLHRIETRMRRMEPSFLMALPDNQRAAVSRLI